MKYPKTITSLVLAIIFALAFCVELAYMPKNRLIAGLALFLTGYYIGIMTKEAYCERFHDRKWYRKMLDEEFDKVVTIREAEAMVNGG